MSTELIGTTFPSTAQWFPFEQAMIASIRRQIDNAFSDKQNLLVNMTWFGPQFDNDQYAKFLTAVADKKYDNLFLLAGVDPVFLNQEKLDALTQTSKADCVYYMGNFDGPYQFNLPSIVVSKIFQSYTESEIDLQGTRYLYLNYNRKPRPHRVDLVNRLYQENLDGLGIITLGEDTDVAPTAKKITVDHFDEQINSMGVKTSVFGIPDDVSSLGDLDIWNNHFLNIVSETEFFPWDNVFVTEKTWKPVIGMRPFVINGQTKIYTWLRKHGFRTFNHHWPHIEMEDLTELEVHDSIVSVIQYLATQDTQQMYQHMRTDLAHNRNRLAEFAREQQHTIDHLFV